MRIFVAGGTGFVGGHLVDRLLGDGHSVRLLTHSGRVSGRKVETVAGDAADLTSYAHALPGCDAIINLVGIIREFPGRGVTFQRLHVDVTEALLQGAKAAGIRRYVHMSALGARPGAVSGYHRSKFDAEELVRGSGLDFTVFRPSIIFGRGDAFINMLAGYLRSYGVVPMIGEGGYRMQPIAVEDVTRCFADSLSMPETVGETYQLCGMDRFSYAEMLDIIARALGRRRAVKLGLPPTLMKLAVPLLQNIPAFPLTTDQMIMLFEENICDGAWRRTFTFEPLPFEAGIARYLS